MASVESQFAAFRDRFERLQAEIGRAFVGQPDLVERLLICLFAGGHVLLEGLPGLGKTLLVTSLGEVLGLKWSRIQCTPDLMPPDIIGTSVLFEDGRAAPGVGFQKGALFAHLVLADEVNRATPKTQSAFLEAMQEGKVTSLGTSYELERPFMLLATQNPIELEGTYPLPEAQLDRFFFKLDIAFPSLADLSRIIDLTTAPEVPVLERVCDREEILEMSAQARRVKIAEAVKHYALRLVTASHPQSEEAPPAVKRYVRYGASPRAAQSMILGAKVRALAQGRYNVALEDLKDLAPPSLAHRVILNFDADMAGVSRADIVRDLLALPER